MKYRLILLRVLKEFDEPLCESNTERQVKVSDGISKEVLDNTFIVKFKNFIPGVKTLKLKSDRKNKCFPKSKNLHESPELRHF